jgi:hypothetical protein
MVNSTPRPLYRRERTAILIEWELGGPQNRSGGFGKETLATTGIRRFYRPARKTKSGKQITPYLKKESTTGGERPSSDI